MDIKQVAKSRKVEKWTLENNRIISAIIQNDEYADITVMERKTKLNVKKINKTEYVNLSTGEIKKYNLSENKCNIESIRKTFKELIYLIRHNFTSNSENQLFITLTYAENMEDKGKLYNDFKNFYKRLKRRYKGIKFDYILVAEPQERGAWHIHLMLKADKPLYIHDSVIRELWGHGITQAERLKSDDVGKYYVAYFTNLEIETKDERSKEKKYVKGARLQLYPSGMKIYRTTKGIKKPPKIDITFGELQKQFGAPIWKQEYEIFKAENGSEEIVNKLYKASFKKQN